MNNIRMAISPFRFLDVLIRTGHCLAAAACTLLVMGAPSYAAAVCTIEQAGYACLVPGRAGAGWGSAPVPAWRTHIRSNGDDENAGGTLRAGLLEAGFTRGTFAGAFGKFSGSTLTHDAYTMETGRDITVTHGRDINNLEDLVGEYVDAIGKTHGSAWHTSRNFWTLDIADAARAFIKARHHRREFWRRFWNDRCDPGDIGHPPKPVPLPAPLGLLAAGAAFLFGGFGVRRRKR